MFKKISVLFLILSFICSNILNIQVLNIVNAAGIDLYGQKLSTDTSSAFSNPTDSLSVQPDQYFRFESYLKNNETNSITNVSYYTNFPSDIVYSGGTTAATQVNGASTYIVPIASFNPPTSVPNYINGLSSLTTGSIYSVKRILLKFPLTHATYSNNLSTYFTADSGLNSNTRTSIVYVNVKPHIIDYSFSKSSIIGNGSDSTDLTVKVKDYNGCSNIDAGVVNANLSSLGLSSNEILTYDSCDSDGKTAIFKKIGITSLSTVGDKILSYTDFYAKDEDNNITDPNDINTTFDDEDKKTNLVLNVASSNAPIITLGTPSLSKVSLISPYNASDINFSSTQTGTYTIALGSCINAAIGTGIYDTIGANINYNINSSLLGNGDNTIFVCLTNSTGDIGSSNVVITKDTTAPNIYSMGLSPGAVVLNNSTGSIYCSEDGQYRFGVGSNYTSYKTSVKDVKNEDVIQNSWLNLGSNTVNAYCKDSVGNESTINLNITKESLPPDMTSSGLTLTDDDVQWDGVDGRDLKVTWDNTVGSTYSSFESYRIYILPENTSFTGTWVGTVYDKNIDTWTGSSTLTTDSLGNPLAGGNYVAYVAIMGTSLNIGTPASATGILIADVVPHPSVLSASFTSTGNLRVKFDTPLKTDLSIHSATGYVFQVGGTTYTGTSISSVSNDTINVTIPDVVNTAATGTLSVSTGAAWGVPVDGSFNNATGGVLVSDSISPNISSFTNKTVSYYNGFYSGSIDISYNISETLKAAGSTKIEFSRVGGNSDVVKTYYITDPSKLTSGTHTISIDLASLGLISGAYYEAKLIATDLVGNNTNSSPISIKFDNSGPDIVSINPFGPNKVFGFLAPTFTWISASDNSGNGSGVKGYKIRIFTGTNTYTDWKTCTGSYTDYVHTDLNSLSKDITLSNLYNYARGVYAYDNMENIGTISSCDNFYINTNVPGFSNASIKDTVLNSTSYTKDGNNLVIKSTITNSDSSHIWLNASTLKDGSYSNISCSSPVSGVTCDYSSNIATYTFTSGSAIGNSGVKQVQFTATNISGINTGTTLTSITVDNTLPVAPTISSPSSSIYGGNSLPIVYAGASDNDRLSYLKYEYSSNGGSSWTTIGTGVNSSPYNWDISGVTSGSNYKFKISAYDKVGNTSSNETPVFSIDKVAPTVPSNTIISPNGGEKLRGGNTVSITWNAGSVTDNISLATNPITLYYSIDGGTNYTQIATSESNDGIYSWLVPSSINSSSIKIKLEAVDNVGNKSFDVSDSNFEIDSTAPAINVSYAGNGGSTPQTNKYVNNSGIDITSVISDTNLAGGNIYYSFYNQSKNLYWNGSSWVSSSEIFNNISSSTGAIYNLSMTIYPTIIESDTYKLKIKGTDVVGNSTTIPQITYFGDLTGPNINISNPVTIYSSGNVLLSGTSSDNLSGLSSVKAEIKKGSNYWNSSDFSSITSVLLNTNSSDSYTNWTYNFAMPLSDDDNQNYTFKAISYDKAYKTNNSSSRIVTIIKDTTGPNITDGLFTFDTSGIKKGGSNLNITWNTGALSDSGAGLNNNSIKLEYFNGTSYVLIADNLANNGTYNWTVATLDTSSRIRITSADNIGNVGNSVISNPFIVDSTPPTISSVETRDFDTNGQIDGMIVKFSELVNGVTGSGFTIPGSTINSVSLVPASDSKTYELHFSNTGTTASTPDLIYNGNYVTDIAGNNLANVTKSSIDKASPRFTHVNVYDTNSNGKLDKIELVSSENMANTTNISGISLENPKIGMSIASLSVTANKINLFLNEGNDIDTSTG
ncbi:MAG: hypothetical protein PHR68_01250, partial [Candidatus Gracilibacteria bacterium]|nr:hypothetical protein [Candidatus Gracilibacteria bacterium]